MKKTLLLIATVLLLGGTTTKATHIIGGEWLMQYVCSDNAYHITLHFYRDCAVGNAPFQTPIPVAIYDKVTNAMVDSFCMTLKDSDYLDFINSCYKLPVCIQLGVYDTTITLPSDTDGCYIAYSRCCRNGIIANISNPGAAAEVWYAEFPDPANHNSLPVFNNDLPKVYMCGGNLNTLDFSATDADHDSLVYSLVIPLNGNLNVSVITLSSSCAPQISNSKPLPDPGPYPLVLLEPPYDSTNMIGTMSIDPNTGILIATPANQGVFVFCVRVEEYDKATKLKLGEVRKDVQIDVLPCIISPPPAITVSPIYPLNLPPDSITAGDSISFSVTVTGVSNKTVYLNANSVLLNNGYNASLIGPDSGITTLTDTFIFVSSVNYLNSLYQITFTGSSTCATGSDTSYTVNIIVTASGITIQPQNQTANSGSTAKFWVTDVDTGTITYQWQANCGSGFYNLSNVAPYSGVNTDTLAVSNVNSNMSNCIFHCIVSDSLHCTVTSTEAVLTVIAGINENTLANSFTVSPNPTTNQLTIHTSSFHSETVTVSIMNVLGEIMQEEKLKWSNETNINIKALPAGIYFVQVSNESSRWTGKFVKE